MRMNKGKEGQIWRIVRDEAAKLQSAVEHTSLEYDDLLGYGWQHILEELSAGSPNCEDYLRNWAHDGMVEALRREQSRPQPIGLI